MDFPKFFRTGIQNLIIDSARWRGLAVQVKSSGLFRSIRGTGEDEIHAVTGSQFTDRDIAEHIVIKPMKISHVSAAGTILAARPGIRYFVHSIQMSSSHLVTDAGTTINCSGTIDGVAVVLCIIRSTALVALPNVSISVQPDALLDVNTALTLFATNISSVAAVVAYAEVGAS